MKVVHENRIRQRAYEIWELSGRPEGRDREHWELAEKELLDAAPDVDTAVSAVSATKTQPAGNSEDGPRLMPTPRHDSGRAPSRAEDSQAR